VGCTNSIAPSNGAICSGIVFLHPTPEPLPQATARWLGCSVDVVGLNEAVSHGDSDPDEASVGWCCVSQR
jgi:hypothetical protein